MCTMTISHLISKNSGGFFVETKRRGHNIEHSETKKQQTERKTNTTLG